MAKRAVVEIQCSRCERTEYREAALEGQVETAFTAAYRAGLELMTVQFDDLCNPCSTTIKGHLSAIAKKIEGLSPARQKKEKEKVVASTPVNGKKVKAEIVVVPPETLVPVDTYAKKTAQ